MVGLWCQQEVVAEELLSCIRNMMDYEVSLDQNVQSKYMLVRLQNVAGLGSTVADYSWSNARHVSFKNDSTRP